LSSSGAPRKTEGIKSRNVWVIANETINTTNERGAIAKKE
jgi:hypothetical protein